MARIVISRPENRWVERWRSFKIILDGQQVAALSRGGQVALEVDAGRHTVRARVDWHGSRTVELDLADHDHVHLTCEPLSVRAFYLLYFYVVLARPNGYLKLFPESGNPAIDLG
jgi:hypothetical protein